MSLKWRPPFTAWRIAGENFYGDTVYAVEIDWQDGRGHHWEPATDHEQRQIKAIVHALSPFMEEAL